MASAPRPDRLVLWDIDGTLVRPGRAAARAFVTAVTTVTGRDATGHGVVMSGKTDWQIATEILSFVGLSPAEADRTVGEVLGALAAALAADAAAVATGGRVLPGVEAAIDRLATLPHVRQTLLTGNIAPNARTKLAAFGLADRLELGWGAYGDDHVDREALVPFALRRVAEATGRPIAPADAWVVGDTPRDLSCARAAGARCLLVATGHFTMAQLTPLGAEATLPDLADTERVVAILAG